VLISAVFNAECLQHRSFLKPNLATVGDRPAFIAGHALLLLASKFRNLVVPFSVVSTRHHEGNLNNDMGNIEHTSGSLANFPLLNLISVPRVLTEAESAGNVA
jgi:hypothetical protein